MSQNSENDFFLHSNDPVTLVNLITTDYDFQFVGCQIYSPLLKKE